jgi:hypothetical protein
MLRNIVILVYNSCVLKGKTNISITDNYWTTVLKEEFEDTKGLIRIRKSKKDRQHNWKKKKRQKDKQT